MENNDENFSQQIEKEEEEIKNQTRNPTVINYPEKDFEKDYPQENDDIETMIGNTEKTTNSKYEKLYQNPDNLVPAVFLDPEVVRNLELESMLSQIANPSRKWSKSEEKNPISTIPAQYNEKSDHENNQKNKSENENENGDDNFHQKDTQEENFNGKTRGVHKEQQEQYQIEKERQRNIQQQEQKERKQKKQVISTREIRISDTESHVSNKSQNNRKKKQTLDTKIDTDHENQNDIPVYDTDYGEEAEKDERYLNLLHQIDELKRELKIQIEANKRMGLSNEDFDQQRKMEESIMEEKKELLYEFYLLETERNVRMTRKFTYRSNIEEMRLELNKIKSDIAIRDSVNEWEKNLVTAATFVEKVNNRKDPFGFRLDGYSNAIKQGMHTLRPAFLEIAKKQMKSKKNQNPYYQIAKGLVMAGFSVHMSNDPDPKKEKERQERKEKKKKERAEKIQQRNFQKKTNIENDNYHFQKRNNLSFNNNSSFVKPASSNIIPTKSTNNNSNNNNNEIKPSARKSRMKGPNIDPKLDTVISVIETRSEMEKELKEKEDEAKKNKTSLFDEFKTKDNNDSSSEKTKKKTVKKNNPHVLDI